MALKPGKKKAINIKVQSFNQLKALKKKLERLKSALFLLSRSKKKVNIDGLKNEFTALEGKLNAAIRQKAKEIENLITVSPTQNVALMRLVNSIEKECSQVIEYYRQTRRILLRGMRKTNPEVFVGRSTTSRRPKDSDKDLQAAFDRVLQKEGFKALRSNSIFTTSDPSIAQDYGRPYYIFPKNGFHFHWYKKEEDLVLDNPGMFYDENKIEKVADAATRWYEKTYDKELYWNFDPSDNLPRFINLLKSRGYPGAAKLTPEQFIDYKWIRQEIAPTQTDFAAALKSGHEVLIFGEYYAIRAHSPVAFYVLQSLKLKSAYLDDED